MAFQSQTYAKYNPQTMQLLQQLLQQGTQGLQNYKPTSFEPYAEKARRNFASKTIPLIAERFGNEGDERGSSALNSMLKGAGSELDSTLAMLGAQHDAQQQAQAMQLYQLLTQLGLSAEEAKLLEEEPGWGKTLVQGGVNMAPEILSLLGYGVGSLVPGLGNLAGGALGNLIGTGIKKGFGTGEQTQIAAPEKPWYELLPQQQNAPSSTQTPAYNPAQFNPNVLGSYFSQLNKYNQNPMPRLA